MITYDEHHERNVPYDLIPCTTPTQINGTSSTVNATYGSINIYFKSFYRYKLPHIVLLRVYNDSVS